MRLPALSATIALLLGACAVDQANDSANMPEQANDLAPEASDGPGNEAAPTAGSPERQPPGNGSQAPEPSGDVTLSAAPARTTEGASMSLTLRNGSREQLGYNLCTSALETSAGRPVPSGRICTMELRTLEPGRNATYSYELPKTMVEGSYRFLTQVEWMGSGRRTGVRSNSFEVRPD